MASGKITEEFARRIARAVKKIESQNHPLGYNRANSANNSENGFWAEIVDSDDNGKYAWEKLKPSSTGTFAKDSNWGSGSLSENTAYEVNESKTVLKEERVFLRPSMSQDFYIFEYSPSGKIGKADADIPLMEDDKPGSGDVKLYELDDTGTLVELSPSQTVTAYNTASDDVAKDAFLQLKYIGTEWFVDFEDCSAGDEEA